jgi:hypothetical protein
MSTLVFRDEDSGKDIVLPVGRLLVAGFAGRDVSAVEHHIAELAELGVPAPERFPTLYPLGPDLVRQSSILVAQGAGTSGEVEPVVFISGGRRWLAVGSDHTDRDLERTDIGLSKAACLKIVGRSCFPLDLVTDPDGCLLESDADGVAYQRGRMASLLPLEDLLSELERNEGLQLAEGDVLFMGTVPVLDAIHPADRFDARLVVSGGPTLALNYEVVDRSSTRVPDLAKPELEFGAVEDVAWTPVPGGPAGLDERILAPDEGRGVATRMLRFLPGVDTSANGVLRHDFWEEVFILEGELVDLTLGQTFGPGSYACRPPGMPHGPWVSPGGCVTFEVRYPAV